jgi:Flp pilus assembly protein CpaB
VPKDTVRLGALIDPASLRTGVALNDIFPGQQLVDSDFGVPSNVLDTSISGSQRALSFPIDASRTLNAQISAGDHVDIYWSVPGKMIEILQNVPVISLAPGGGEITMLVNPTDAAKLAYATDNGKLWFSLRAKVGVPSQAPVIVTGNSLDATAAK